MPANEEKLRAKVEEQRGRISQIHSKYERLRKDLIPFGGIDGVRSMARENELLKGKVEDLQEELRAG